MARTSTSTPCRDNAVIARLKAGKGAVAGLKMLVAVDGRALVPVVVTGLDFYARGDSSRSVSVRVDPVGGHGHLWVAPHELIDDKPSAIALHERKCLAHDRYRQVANSNSDRQRRSELLNIRSEMSASQRKQFAAILAERIGDKAATDPVVAINRMSGEWEFKRVADLAVKVRYDLVDDEFDAD